MILIRFKKLFSTDEIIERTRAQMDEMLRDLNNNAARNIDLLEDRMEKLRALMKEADRKIQTVENELNLQAPVSNIRSQIENLQKNSVVTKSAAYRALESYKNAMETSNGTEEVMFAPRHYNQQKVQMRTPEVGDADLAKKQRNNRNIIYSMPLPEEVKAAEPVRTQKITFAQNQISNEKTFAQKVAQFAKLGFDAEHIARELACSKTEVELIMSLSNNF